jgi:hypothetical protein
MKRIIGLLLTLCVVFSPLTSSFAEEEIYWGQAPPTDSEITDQDFSIDFDKHRTIQTFGDQEIYDTYKARDLLQDPQSGSEEALQTQTSAPIQSQPSERSAPPIRTNISSPASPSRSVPANTAPARVVPATPKPAETTPGSIQPASSAEATPNTGAVQSSGDQELDKPATKKMKWGQTESDSQESANKFQWGKKGLTE